MKTRKIISLFITFVMLFSLIGLPNTGFSVMAAEQSTPATVPFVIDDFEDSDLSDWGFRNETHKNLQSATVVEENGNKFLRVNFNGNYAASYDGAKSVAFSK